QISDRTPVSVTAGIVTSGIDIALNGFNTAALPVVNEVEGNDKKKKAQRLTFPVEVHGSASDQDAGKHRIDFGEFGSARIHDLYRFTVNTTGVFVIALDPISGAGDMDLYLLDESFEGKKISISSPSIAGSSTSPQASELIGVRLIAGTYYVGVSAFAGSFNYRLRIISSQ
ncbi:MAG TPA: PPC domain-containing protein, partial [Blastocatellia bacterium]|nr:PPC domain-containing protein [Blastocatellia bacterium]